DVVLQVGQVNEQITVNTLGPQLETQNSDLGQVVGSRRIETLPLNGRNYAQLAQLSVGVALPSPDRGRRKPSASARTGHAHCRIIFCSMALTIIPISVTCSTKLRMLFSRPSMQLQNSRCRPMHTALNSVAVMAQS